MKLLGHPIHPLLIHFPTALLPMDLALSVLYYSSGNASYYQAGAYCLWAGASLGVLAVVTGLIELRAIPRSAKRSIALAWYHGFVNGSIILAFCLVAYKTWQAFPSPYLTGLIGIIVKGALICALFVGNYMGGRLIYKHHIGISLKNNANEDLAA